MGDNAKTSWTSHELGEFIEQERRDREEDWWVQAIMHLLKCRDKACEMCLLIRKRIDDEEQQLESRNTGRENLPEESNGL